VSRRRAWRAAAALALAACGTRDDPVARAADTTSPEGHFVAPALQPGGAPPCALGALWAQCSVRERLERAGLAPQPVDTVRHAFLHVPGQRYKVGDAELQAFVYETTDMRQRDTAPLDSVRAAPPGVETSWERPPTLITSGNLAAILIGGNERQVERVTLALTAGAGTTDFQSGAKE
jgi:hypothetical protein